MKTLTCPAILLISLAPGICRESAAAAPKISGQIVKTEPIKQVFLESDWVWVSATAVLGVSIEEKISYQFTLEISATNEDGKLVAKAWSKTTLKPGDSCPRLGIKTAHLRAAKGNYRISATLTARPINGPDEYVVDEKTGKKSPDLTYSVR